jgi:hypothetical protein
MRLARHLRLISTLAALVMAPLVQAQVGHHFSEFAPIDLESGSLDNPALQAEIVFDGVAAVDEDAPWIRLSFDEANLAPGSSIRITSLYDGAVQDLTADTIEQWHMTTAFFNGNAVRVELVAGPETAGNSFRIAHASYGLPPGPQPLTLCDGDDDRVADSEDGFARMVTDGLSGPCSATIVTADGCFFSAGHCLNFLEVAQFNVPQSTSGGSMQHPPPFDQYMVDEDTLRSQNGGIGNDWAHFKCFPNTQTDLTPVEAEGIFYPLADSLPVIDTTLYITGFGSDSGSTDNTQQTDDGPYKGTSAFHRLRHRVDTQGGNSGSSIIIEATDEVIGIHTNAGCEESPTSTNSGTAITNPNLAPELICCEPPNIIENPEPVLICSGEDAVFSVVAEGEDLTYQWLRNGDPIDGATSDTLVIPFAQPVDAGIYSVLVRDPCEIESAPAELTLDPPPGIQDQPDDLTLCPGGDAEFSVVPLGEGPFFYQWQFEGEDIPGAVDSTLIVPGTTFDDEGDYTVLIDDGCGEGPSSPATLSLIGPPLSISAQPMDQTVAIGQQAAFFVFVDGAGPIFYQWRHDGVDIPGATSFFLVLPSTTCDADGVYDAVLTNPCDDVTTNPATLTVEGCAVIPYGDLDADGDVDLVDFGEFQLCFTGSGGAATSECTDADADEDGDVDLVDFGQFQLAFTG